MAKQTDLARALFEINRQIEILTEARKYLLEQQRQKTVTDKRPKPRAVPKGETA